MNIPGARVLVTGGGSGIGRHLVDRLVAEGASVAVLDIDTAALARLRADHEGVKGFACDVADPDSVAAAISALYAEEFVVEVLINNAGIIYSAPLINILGREDRMHPFSMWRKVIATNLDSVFLVTAHVANQMTTRRTKGVIINISSISARGNAGQSAYAAAKAGVNALTKTWAKELGPLGIRCAAIAPGFMDTPSTRQALSENVLARLRQQVPLRQLGTTEHVFEAVRAIVTNDYISGTILEIDGGLVL